MLLPRAPGLDEVFKVAKNKLRMKKKPLRAFIITTTGDNVPIASIDRLVDGTAICVSATPAPQEVSSAGARDCHSLRHSAAYRSAFR